MPRKKKEWTPHKYLVAAARKTWRWSPARKSCLDVAEIAPNQWQCSQCRKCVTKIDYVTKRGRKRRKIDGAVDHKEPVGKQPKEWDEYPAYYRRMFCDNSNLQFLCTSCHKPKSLKETKIRQQGRKC